MSSSQNPKIIFSKKPKVEAKHEEKKDDLVIVDIPSGKKYLTESKSQHQSQQKQGTCWYYVFNWLRPRIGKLENKLPATAVEMKEADNPDLAALQHKRHIERIISKYRKQTTEIDRIKYAEETFIGQDKEKIKKILEQYKTSYEKLLVTDQKKPLFKYYIDFLESFLGQDTSSLEEFINNRYFERTVIISKKTINNLGRNVETELQRQIELCLSPDARVPFDRLSLEESAAICSTVITRVAAEEYQLKFSNWHPEQGWEGLARALKEEGALAIATDLGEHRYTTKATTNSEIDKIGEYQVYSWPKEEALNDEITAAHEILIVGALQIKTKDEFDSTVIYLDPNDESKPGEPRKAYRVSYDVFCKNLSNINGVSLSLIHLMEKTPTSKPTPFAYCKNKEDIQQTKEQYMRTVAR